MNTSEPEPKQGPEPERKPEPEREPGPEPRSDTTGRSAGAGRRRRFTVIAIVAGSFALVASLTAGLVVALVVTPYLVGHGMLGPFADALAAAAPQTTATQAPANPAPANPDPATPAPGTVPSAADQAAIDSCVVISAALGVVGQKDFVSVMANPTADVEKSKEVVSSVSAQLDADYPQLTGVVGQQVSSVMESLDAETTALNRYSADPSVGIDDVSEGVYEIQFALMMVADSCVDAGQPDSSGPQTVAKACEILNESTARADLANSLRKAEGNAAQTIAAINVYANDLEVGLSQVTNPDILAAAKASDTDLRAEAKALKAFETDPSTGNQAITDAAGNAQKSALALVTACTPGAAPLAG